MSGEGAPRYPRANEHADFCDWHVDQYPWECTCGAIPDPASHRPRAVFGACDVPPADWSCTRTKGHSGPCAAVPAEPARQAYVAGFLFSATGYSLALIRKDKPEWQAGKFNGIGGKIEEGETPHAAMVREFFEETGVEVSEWAPVADLTGPDFVVHFFAAFDNIVFDCRTMESEEVVIETVGAFRPEDLIPNLRVLIPLALDNSGIVKPVKLTDDRKARA